MNLAYFCWHPALGSVGACRQCAVKAFKDENDTQGKMVMACMTPAIDGTRISILHPEAETFRARVIEWLMTNHPHDCPVCEEGGNCHLQDMTVMTGHSRRRYRFAKRTHRNQELGPFIGHEMNRCIACYRCVRYYRDYAQGTDFGVYGAHDNLYFGRVEDGALENEFSGNLVEVCPTGVFTDKTHSARYNRKWDMQFAPSICQQCAVGCNISPGERYGELRRIENRYNGVVNHYFLCDRGRFGYDYVNSPQRIREPLLVREGKTIQISKREGVPHRGTLLRNGRVIGIGSPRAIAGSQFRLARTAVGADHFSTGIADKQFRRRAERFSTFSEIVRHRIPSLAGNGARRRRFRSGRGRHQCDRAAHCARPSSGGPPAVIRRRRSAEDPRLARHRRPGRDHRPARAPSPLFIAGADGDPARRGCRRRLIGPTPEELARLGFAVAHAVDPNAPAVSGLPRRSARWPTGLPRSLKAAERPLVVAGMSLNSEAMIHAAANIASALDAIGKN
ncbi:MAG: hypothetical protein MPW14_05905 [Candidatus Manganitrophus sp.]|nr:MAG: hypothetical protein MPW14_05905 [Candidatus Manganitrophus sp.]